MTSLPKRVVGNSIFFADENVGALAPSGSVAGIVSISRCHKIITYVGERDCPAPHSSSSNLGHNRLASTLVYREGLIWIETTP